MTSEHDVRVEPLLARDEPLLLEPLALDARELLVRELPERPTAPESERLLRERHGKRRVSVPAGLAAFRHESLESRRVERAVGESQDIPATDGLDRDPGREGLAELGDVDANELARRRRRILPPEDVDELLDVPNTTLGEHERGHEPLEHRRRRRGRRSSPECHRPQHENLRHPLAFSRDATARGSAYIGTTPRHSTIGGVTYAFVNDVAASWEHYQRFADALQGPIPEGLVLHAAGPTDEGFRIIAVWESEEAWERFRTDRLGAEEKSVAHVPPVFRVLRPAHLVHAVTP